MGRLIATLVCLLGTFYLIRVDRESNSRTSAALWLPIIWLFIGASRNFSEWLMRQAPNQNSAYTEGSPVDRIFLSALIGLGLIVLFQRKQRVARLLRSNRLLLVYFAYCLLSVLWSDYSGVAGKRWFRAIGDFVMVLVVLSDRNWVDAFKTVLARVGFLLVPLSILLIRYYPDMGRTYAKDGTPSWTGASTDKNALGMFCLLFGLAAVFRLITAPREKGRLRKGPFVAQSILAAMTLYLIHEAHSATALACFVMGGGLMAVTCLFRIARKPAVLHLLVLTILSVTISSLFLGIGTGLLHDIGRNSTLTGRTAIWTAAFRQVRNPVLGTGYESFWIGSRLKEVSKEINQGVNEAHNGYIEIYLNLGAVGVALLLMLLFAGYIRVIPDVRNQAGAGSLRLAYVFVAVAYNFSEAAFKMMHPVWVIFLLSIAALPEPRRIDRSRSIPLKGAEWQDESEMSAKIVERPETQELPPLFRFGTVNSAQVLDPIGHKPMSMVQHPA
jgi:exopolysaccharide production protein ExoQ